MADPVEIREGKLYAGANARHALAQLQADLGSATLAIEEARNSGQMTPHDLTDLGIAHRAVVSALRRMEKVRDAHGWPDPDSP